MTFFARHKELNLLNSESNKLFRELVEHIPLGVFMADDADHLFYVNEAFDQILNFQNRTHALGKNWQDILLPDLKIREDFLYRLHKNSAVSDQQVSITNSNGELVSFLVSAKEIRSSTGDTIGTQGIVLDISKRLILEQKLLNEHHKLEHVLNFYNNLSRLSNIDELAQYMVDQTAQMLECNRCSLMFIDEATAELYIKAAYGIPDLIVQTARVKIGEPVAGLMVLENQAIIVNDIETHNRIQRTPQEQYSNSSFMSAPILHNEEVIGILNVSEKGERFTPRDLRLLQTIAHQSAINIYKTLALSKLEHLSQTDPLTGLLNFRSFNQKLDEEINRAARYSLPLSIMMVDVDNFKTYNDTQGHPSGNALLKTLADVFKFNLRSTEWICRYGGDEFGIILPSVNCAQAAIAAGKLRELVHTKFVNERITLSIGVAQFHPELTKESLIANADQALYHAKKSGRNQVVMSQAHS